MTQAGSGSLAFRPESRAPGRKSFAVATGADPHRERMRQLIRDHPELRTLVGHAPATSAWIAAAAAAQLTLAISLGNAPWWALLLAAYAVGAVLALALWTLLHETTHDLVFATSTANRVTGLIAALPLGLPVASTFRQIHLLHHRHHGHPVLDADVPSAWEARWVRNCPLRKALWLAAGAAIQSLRVLRMKEVRLIDRWAVLTIAVQLGFTIALVASAGWGSLAYLLLSTLFSVGLHPLGGRCIQEHHLVRPGQETFSYYGPMNAFLFNAGYHHEHHDLMRVPWMRLPKVRRMAPEYYSGLHAHRSWTALLLAFLFDRRATLFSRTVRGRPARAAVRP
jgi:sphingolipid delta-4 desaturase